MIRLQYIIEHLDQVNDILWRDKIGDCNITNLVPLEYADKTCISFCAKKFNNYEQVLMDTQAIALIVSSNLGITLENVSPNVQCLIVVRDALYTAMYVIRAFIVDGNSPGIHSSACMGELTTISASASICANVVMGDKCYIGDNVYIGPNTVIGDNTWIWNDVIIRSNCSIGSDAHYYLHKDEYVIPVISRGGVVIYPGTEIKSNTNINRGLVGNTVLSRDVKIDSNCHIAHDCLIGNRTMIAANTVVAGNTNIGDDCWIGVGVHIKNKVNIGNNVFLGIGAIVTNDILDKQKIIPIPSFGEKITFSHIKDMLYKAMR